MSLPQVSVRVTVTGTEGDAGAFGKQLTFVEGKVTYRSKTIGNISATLVNRQAIADNDIMTVLDEHSSDLEWVGSALLEPRYGRPRLESMAEYDNYEFDFMFISKFHLDEEYLTPNNPDVATSALRNFLHDPEHIKGNLDLGCWRASSAVFVVPAPKASESAASRGSKRKRKSVTNQVSSRAYIDPFLRNGFFQDPVLIREDPDNARLLIATYGQWNQPPKSAATAAGISLLKAPPKPSGKDLEILSTVKSCCQNNQTRNNLASIMAGQATYRPPTDNTTAAEIKKLKSTLTRLIQQGGSLARSCALHAAVEENKPKIVAAILDVASDPAALINAPNAQGLTAWHMAGENGGGRCSINGIDDTQVIDALAAAGANKSLTDPQGRTAYGRCRIWTQTPICRPQFQYKVTAMEQKLLPERGPTGADLQGRHAAGRQSGLVDWQADDDEADREMGRGRYGGDSDGDY